MIGIKTTSHIFMKVTSSEIKLFNRKHVYLSALLGGPIMAGMIYEATGGYNLVFLITIAMLTISVGAFLLAKTPPREVLPLPSPK